MNETQPVLQEDEAAASDNTPTGEPQAYAKDCACRGIDCVAHWIGRLTKNPYVRCKRTHELSLFQDAEASEPEDTYRAERIFGLSAGTLLALLATGIALGALARLLCCRQK